MVFRLRKPIQLYLRMPIVAADKSPKTAYILVISLRTSRQGDLGCSAISGGYVLIVLRVRGWTTVPVSVTSPKHMQGNLDAGQPKVCLLLLPVNELTSNWILV